MPVSPAVRGNGAIMNQTDTELLAPRTVVAHRLATVDMLPELRERLLGLLDDDLHYLAVARPWGRMLTQIAAILGSSSLAPVFEAAWLVMHAAAMHLDHLQDGDEVAPQLADLPPATQYQLVFSYYVLATAILDDLPSGGLSPERTHSIHRLWSDAMLRIASGQYYDLTVAAHKEQLPSLDAYQELAHAKTGAAFGLAFAGLAILNDHSAALCGAMLTTGELFGGLLQYVDDLIDEEVSLSLIPASKSLGDPLLWERIFFSYRHAIEQLLSDYEPGLMLPVLQLFDRTFARPAAAA